MGKNKIILISLTQNKPYRLITNEINEALTVKQEKQLLSFREVCQWLSISPSCLNLWKSQGKIPYEKLRKSIFFSRVEITDALQSAGNYENLRDLR